MFTLWYHPLYCLWAGLADLILEYGWCEAAVEESPVLPAQADPVAAADHLATMLPAQLQARAVCHWNAVREITNNVRANLLFFCNKYCAKIA